MTPGTVALSPDMTSEKAAAFCLRDCLEQIEQNRRETLEQDGLEGPHQLRVGLRRLRSALGLFRPVIGGIAASELADAAREIGRSVGRTRDLDVFVTEILPQLAGDLPDEDAATAIREHFRHARAQERAMLRQTLCEERTDDFLRNLDDFIRKRRWIVPEDYDQTETLARPLGHFAAENLAIRWRKTRKLARHLSGPDVEKRHEFRKDLKKLRYAVDFLRTIYPEEAMKPFRKRLKKLQDKVGVLNDVATARQLAEEERQGGSLDAEAVGMLENAVACLDERSIAHLDRAQGLWRDLASARRPWDDAA